MIGGFFFDQSGSNEDFVERNYYLLVIGIDKYKHYDNLFNAVRDAAGLKETLLERYQFEEGNVYELYDEEATRENILQSLDQIAAKSTKEDTLLIFHAGHGYYRERPRMAYWLTHDSERGQYDKCIEHSTIQAHLKGLDIQHILLIDDSCFSGAMFQEIEKRGNVNFSSYIRKLDNKKSRWCITAGSLETVSGGLIGGHSPFSEQLIKYLQSYSEPRLLISDLTSHVCKETGSQTDATPIGGPMFGMGDRQGQYHFKLREAYISDKEIIQLDPIRSPSKLFVGILASLFLLFSSNNLSIEKRNLCGAPISQDIDSSWVDRSNYPDLHPEMIPIRGGRFQILRPTLNFSYEVHLSNFALAQFEVTIGDYQKYLLAKRNKGTALQQLNENQKLPQTHVSWKDALDYCNWLSEQRGLSKVYCIQDRIISVNWTADGYRLPTEAEWEFAARERGKNYVYGSGLNTAGPDNLVFKTVNYSPETKKLNEKGLPIPDFIEGTDGTVEVNTLCPNGLGIYHMSGNVSEWCWDVYSRFEPSKKILINPHGKSKHEDYMNGRDAFSIRGGSFLDSKEDCEIKNRGGRPPMGIDKDLGFRIARSLGARPLPDK